MFAGPLPLRSLRARLMRYLVVLTGLLALLFAPTAAQPSAPPTAPLLSADGVLGIGHVYNGRGGGYYGLTMGFDVRYRQHGIGLRTRAFTPLLGSSSLWEAGGVYSFNVVGGLSLGVGVSYVFESDFSPRIGVPLEITFRLQDPESFGPFVRGFANVNGETTFGGVSLGITL